MFTQHMGSHAFPEVYLLISQLFVYIFWANSCLFTFRLSWVVGQAGLIEGLCIITLANLVTLITSISMSAVSTNGKIKGGGIYYMLSRSLGNKKASLVTL